MIIGCKIICLLVFCWCFFVSFFSTQTVQASPATVMIAVDDAWYDNNDPVRPNVRNFSSCGLWVGVFVDAVVESSNNRDEEKHGQGKGKRSERVINIVVFVSCLQHSDGSNGDDRQCLDSFYDPIRRVHELKHAGGDVCQSHWQSGCKIRDEYWLAHQVRIDPDCLRACLNGLLGCLGAWCCMFCCCSSCALCCCCCFYVVVLLVNSFDTGHVFLSHLLLLLLLLLLIPFGSCHR